MDPIPAELAALAKEATFPLPSDPTDPRANFVLSIKQGRLLLAVLNGLLDYIVIEYGRCGKTA